MTDPAASPDPVLLAEVTRRDVSGRDVVESLHHAHAVITDGDGAVLWAAGEPTLVTFVRSTAKPFQATACLEVLREAGWPGGRPSDAEVAVGWASHAGADVHLATVRQLLARSGVEPEALTCPADVRPDVPSDGRRRLHHNCSGKHALFALAGRAMGVAGSDLLDPSAPFQQHLLGAVGDALGPFEAIGVDGCGAPAVAVPLARLAHGFAQLVVGTRWADARAAGLANPVLVGGTSRLETALLDAGIVAKPGAEGVFAVGWVDSGGPRGLAVKVADGANRAAEVITRAILDRLGVAPTPAWVAPTPLGGGRAAGLVRAVLDVATVRLPG